MAATMRPLPQSREILRLLIVPAVLTVLTVLYGVNAGLAGDSDLLETILFWVAVVWGGIALFLAGRWYDAFLRSRAA